MKDMSKLRQAPRIDVHKTVSIDRVESENWWHQNSRRYVIATHVDPYCQFEKFVPQSLLLSVISFFSLPFHFIQYFSILKVHYIEAVLKDLEILSIFFAILAFCGSKAIIQSGVRL